MGQRVFKIFGLIISFIFGLCTKLKLLLFLTNERLYIQAEFQVFKLKKLVKNLPSLS